MSCSTDRRFGSPSQIATAKALGAHGIRVNPLTLGAVAAGGFKPGADLAEKIPLGRLANAEDVAAMGVVLMSERYAGYVTGADIVVDRRLSLHNWFAPEVP